MKPIFRRERRSWETPVVMLGELHVALDDRLSLAWETGVMASIFGDEPLIPLSIHTNVTLHTGRRWRRPTLKTRNIPVPFGLRAAIGHRHLNFALFANFILIYFTSSLGICIAAFDSTAFWQS